MHSTFRVGPGIVQWVRVTQPVIWLNIWNRSSLSITHYLATNAFVKSAPHTSCSRPFLTDRRNGYRPDPLTPGTHLEWVDDRITTIPRAFNSVTHCSTRCIACTHMSSCWKYDG